MSSSNAVATPCRRQMSDSGGNKRSGGGGILSKLKKRTQSECQARNHNDIPRHHDYNDHGGGGGGGDVLCKYNQPLNPEDAILTPSGGYVSKRWLLKGAASVDTAMRQQRSPTSYSKISDNNEILPASPVPPDRPAAAECTASPGTKSKSFRLWKSVMKRCRKISRRQQQKEPPPLTPHPPPPRCVLERAATWDLDDEDGASCDDLDVDDEVNSGGSRKCSYHSDLKASKAKCRGKRASELRNEKLANFWPSSLP